VFSQENVFSHQNVFVCYTLKYQAYADAWVVDDVDLSAKGTLRGGTLIYHLEQQYPTVLVFVAGPNCGQMGKGPSSTMRRTFNKYMEQVCILCVAACEPKRLCAERPSAAASVPASGSSSKR